MTTGIKQAEQSLEGIVFNSKWAHDIFMSKYSMNKQESWYQLAKRVAYSVCEGKIPTDKIEQIVEIIALRKFIPGGRYLYSAGRDFHTVNNCYLFRAEDSREGWGDLADKVTVSLMTGGGIGVDYSAVRPWGLPVKRTGGFATGPLSLMQIINESGRFVMQGGQRRSAIWAGLSWWHPDQFPAETHEGKHPGFLRLKDWAPPLRAAKQNDLTFSLPMELTNVSVIYDTLFFDLMDARADLPIHEAGGIVDTPWGTRIPVSVDTAEKVWLQNCKQAFKKAEPGMSFNYMKDRESLRNACTEVTSEDDSDKCNLGTLWLNHITNLQDMIRTTELATIFLMCGGIYSHVPTNRIREVGDQNNRIGLGLGGIHEWLMRRGYGYEVVPELHEWLTVYRDISDVTAEEYAHRLKIAVPKGKRAIAPTGTIGIVAETTTGIEPLFCKAYKRRYYEGGKWKYQFVVDGSVRRLQEYGVPLDKIQDAYDLSFEQRVKFQADIQDPYVDMAISSTCNMAPWGSKDNNEGTVEKNAAILYKYAKRLRGFTCYPDGARTGQPLERVDDVAFALNKEGSIFEEKVQECNNGVCGL